MLNSFFNEDVTIYLYSGKDRQGQSKFTQGDTIRARVEPTSQMATDSTGNTVVVEKVVYTKREDITDKDELEIDNTRYEILKLDKFYRKSNFHHIEIELRKHA